MTVTNSGYALIPPEQREAIGRLQIVHRVCQALLDARDVPTVANEALRELAAAAGMEVSWVYTLDSSVPDGPKLRLVARRGVSPPRVQQQALLPLGVGLSGQVALCREPFFVTSLDELSPPMDAFAAFAREDNVEALGALPMLVDGELLGVLGVGLPRRHEWSRQDRELLSIITGLLALGIERAALHARLPADACCRHPTVETACKGAGSLADSPPASPLPIGRRPSVGAPLPGLSLTTVVPQHRGDVVGAQHGRRERLEPAVSRRDPQRHVTRRTGEYHQQQG